MSERDRESEWIRACTRACGLAGVAPGYADAEGWRIFQRLPAEAKAAIRSGERTFQPEDGPKPVPYWLWNWTW